MHDADTLWQLIYAAAMQRDVLVGMWLGLALILSCKTILARSARMAATTVGSVGFAGLRSFERPERKESVKGV